MREQRVGPEDCSAHQSSRRGHTGRLSRLQSAPKATRPYERPGPRDGSWLFDCGAHQFTGRTHTGRLSRLQSAPNATLPVRKTEGHATDHACSRPSGATCAHRFLLLSRMIAPGIATSSAGCSMRLRWIQTVRFLRTNTGSGHRSDFPGRSARARAPRFRFCCSRVSRLASSLLAAGIHDNQSAADLRDRSHWPCGKQLFGPLAAFIATRKSYARF